MSEFQVTKLQSVSPSDFPQFGRLPPEMRIAIWKLAMEEPRIIHISPFLLEPTPRKIKMNGLEYEQVPEFFFVSRECRWVAQVLYSATAVDVHFRGGCIFGCPRTNFLLSNKDTFAFKVLAFSSNDGPICSAEISIVDSSVIIRNYMFISASAGEGGFKRVVKWARGLRGRDVGDYIARFLVHRVYGQAASSTFGNLYCVFFPPSAEAPSNFTFEDLIPVPEDAEPDCDGQPPDEESQPKVIILKMRGTSISL
ncbi:hypothetical protein F5Y19DRAFT_434132 [Xylariaceae sp. FL1651]|nr:hypothetical protein F5Y19DRAFT_434132 [Xylariaceae sp. FL1651]